MKQIKILAMLAITLLASCVTTSKSGYQRQTSGTLITFKPQYITKSAKTIINYTDAELLKISFILNGATTFNSNLFAENYKISGGTVYIVDQTLANLQTLPDSSVCRINDASLIKRDKEGNLTSFTTETVTGYLTYKLVWIVNANGSFSLSNLPEYPSWAEYKDKIYKDVFGNNRNPLLYNVVDTIGQRRR